MNVIERNNVKILGRGKKTMIFAHGYGCSQAVWRRIYPAFQDDYQIILFDHVGSGHSSLSAYDRIKYGTLAGYAQDVLEICQQLDLSDSVFVGHSVSAMIGILAAIEKPEFFERLVLIGPSPRYINDEGYFGGFDRESIDELLKYIEKDHQAWSRDMAPVIMGNLDRPELAEELMRSFCETEPEIAKHFAQVTFLSDSRRDLPKLKTPSLILQCSQDLIAPEAVGHYLHQHLKNSELRVLKATGHCAHLSAHEETTRVIREYLGLVAKTSEIISAA